VQHTGNVSLLELFHEPAQPNQNAGQENAETQQETGGRHDAAVLVFVQAYEGRLVALELAEICYQNAQELDHVDVHGVSLDHVHVGFESRLLHVCG